VLLQVVLAAGTVESAKIVKLSNLPDPSNKVGKGITDHPILYTHFGIPPNSPWHQLDGCAKIVVRHRDFAAHPYMVVVELGSDFNQVGTDGPCLIRSHCLCVLVGWGVITGCTAVGHTVTSV
jgi:hypothetical protein